MVQPDFTALFFSSLGGAPKMLAYELRDGPQMIHDAVFLSSLLHDARIQHPRIQACGGRLTIPMDRDCWELGYTERQNCQELHVANCEMRMSGVVGSHWEPGPPEADEPGLDYLWVAETYRDQRTEHFELALVGQDWRYVVAFAKSDWSVTLRDLEVPFLWSDRHAC
jgi:hypothetical protein